jgi:CRP/FNR family transcriptional regulator, cyclic AMP receptor protein
MAITNTATVEKAVKKVDVFKGLDKFQIAELNSWLQRRDYGAGTEIFKEGQLPDGLYVLCSGVVSVVKASSYGKFKLAEVDAPSFFGEMGLLNAAERSAAIRAQTQVVVGLLPSHLFESKLAANNLTALRIALNIGRMLSARLRDTNKKLASQTAIMAKRRPSVGSR